MVLLADGRLDLLGVAAAVDELQRAAAAAKDGEVGVERRVRVAR
tara:strand:+ start:1575 stop:1706 length:132 start_codon:yes stop_codon:yes gene_type:complete